MKSLFVKNLTPDLTGKEIESIFLVAKREVRKKRDGLPYLEIVFSDVTGTIPGVLFDEFEKYESLLQVGKVVNVKGIIGTYNDEIRIKVLHVMDVITFDPKDFVPSTDKDVNILMGDLLKLIDQVVDPYLKGLLKYFFEEDKEFLEKFKRAPAAKSYHHPYIGGLLEHTLGVAEISLTIAKNYPDVNEDLLLTGALLHDIGKVEEYTSFPAIERTDRGRLLGHVVIGYEMVSERIKAMDNYLGGFPEDLALQLLHIILSHHGELSWGSPVVPYTLEAQILHFVDNLNAKAWMFREAREKRKDPDARWSEFHRGLSRMVYLGEPDED
jgi:3'-5' exoribonuclease